MEHEVSFSQTERVLTRLVDVAFLESRLHQSSKGVFHDSHVSRFHLVLSLRGERTTLRGS